MTQTRIHRETERTHTRTQLEPFDHPRKRETERQTNWCLFILRMCLCVWVYTLLLLPNNEGQHKRTNNEQTSKHRMESWCQNYSTSICIAHTEARTSTQPHRIYTLLHSTICNGTYIHRSVHYYASAMRTHIHSTHRERERHQCIRASEHDQTNRNVERDSARKLHKHTLNIRTHTHTSTRCATTTTAISYIQHHELNRVEEVSHTVPKEPKKWTVNMCSLFQTQTKHI